MNECILLLKKITQWQRNIKGKRKEWRIYNTTRKTAKWQWLVLLYQNHFENKWIKFFDSKEKEWLNKLILPEQIKGKPRQDWVIDAFKDSLHLREKGYKKIAYENENPKRVRVVIDISYKTIFKLTL